mgnify:CR=1 FL=1
MGNIFKVLRRDFLRLFKVPAAWVILFGMVFIPPLYSWYNIVGFWDPYGNTKGITGQFVGGRPVCGKAD